MRYIILRSLLFLSIWIPLAVYLFQYSNDEFKSKRFEALVLTNGRVSSMQREYVFRKMNSLQPGDQILKLEGRPFEFHQVKDWLKSLNSEELAGVQYLHKSKELAGEVYLRTYSKRDLLLYIIFPAILSVIFLMFSLVTPFQKRRFGKTKEAIEVFSLLCFIVSCFFITYFPSVTMGLVYPTSVLMPIVGVMLMHLFMVYPKEKGSVRSRAVLLSISYSFAVAIVFLKIRFWFQLMPWWFHLLDVFALTVFFIAGMANLANTLFTSKDFWARRRARLLSLVFLISFMAIVSVFVAFLWQGPRISLERLLGISILFPVAFAFIIAKENVFELERIFRRGVHQFLFMGIAITLAVLVGLGWQQWAEGMQSDWLLWTSIAMTVALLARPVGSFFESRISRLVSARVRYPEVDVLFEQSRTTEDFLIRFSQACEDDLNMRGIRYRFFRNPTQVWGADNEQEWLFHNGRMVRVYESFSSPTYSSKLKRGEIEIGEIAFSGGDALAFDPLTSRDWEMLCHSFSRNLEVLVLREFLSTQQGLLAVGRMQALLAHEMKNPLAVIKVCAGLLQSHTDESEEADEIIKTIQNEVRRVSEGVQNIFNHSGRGEKRERVDVYSVLEKVKSSALARFSGRQIEIQLRIDKEEAAWEPNALWIWTEPEGFRQSVLNLVVNSFEAGSRNVHIEIIFRTGRYLRIGVSDDGPGISKEVELFKPFVSTKPTGTGLGLSHVKAFMDRHSGRIQVQSRPHAGTSFLMEFSPDSVFIGEEEAS